MTAPLSRRWRFKRPRTRDDFARLVERELGTPLDGHVDVPAPDGRTIRVSVRRVVDHYWDDDDPNHWRAVPDLCTAIEHAERRYKSSRGSANRGYFSRLRPTPKRWASRWFVTWTSGSGAVRQWESGFQVDGPLREYRRKNTVGEPEWLAHQSSQRRNPSPASGHLAPARVVSGTSRPDRAPVTRAKSTINWRRPGRDDGWRTLGLALGAALLAWLTRRARL